ncbi:MAG: Phage virion morphosis family [Planctomycetota bacterium]
MPLGAGVDVGSLESIIGALDGLRDLVPEIALEASIEIFETTDSLFVLGADPYGETWAPLAPATLAKGRTPPPLTDTGAMRESLRVAVTETAIVASLESPAGYHQDGTRYMPARPVLPDYARGLPDAWRASITDAGQRVFEARWDK